MGEGRGAAGLSREATVSLFRPARNTVLPFLGLATGMAIWFGVMAGPMLGFGFALKLAAMLAAAAVCSFSQFRDSLLALSVVVSALPGAALVFGGASLASTNTPLGVLVALVYVLGFAVAMVAAERLVLRVVESEDPETTAVVLLRDDWVFPVSILIVSAATPAVIAIASSGTSFDTILLAGGNAVAVLSAWLAVPMLGSFMRAGEDFITRANRIRESWTRRLDPVAKAARSPWAWSTTGIFLVLLVLAFFGSANIPFVSSTRSLLGPAAGAAAVVFLGAALVARDARRAVAVLVATAGSLCLAVWGFARAGASVDDTFIVLGAELIAICFVPIAATAAAAARAAHEDAISASEAGVQAAGPSAVVGMLAALVLLAPWYREAFSTSVGVILALVFAGCGAVVFQPALAGVLEALIPRRKTILERYRVK